MADSRDTTADGVERPSHVPPPGGTVPAAPHDALPTVERRHYQIKDEVARGGMGRVFEAVDLRLERKVAIKLLLPEKRDASRRLEREARITARLQHPAIIHIYEAGVWAGGEPFYAMPMVPGRSLADAVAERTTLAKRLELLPNVIAVANALAYAHSQRVIHRDLKPKNVLVGEFGETVVIDWGLAKELDEPRDPAESLAMRRAHAIDETDAGSVVGTPPYMPPEQARNEPVDQRADVYALGALLYHVLVGEPPYRGTHDAVIERLKENVPYRPVPDRAPGAPLDLVAIVDKAMASDPAQRYADAGELAQDLERFQTGQLVAAHVYTRRQLFWRFLRRHRLALGVSVVAAVALGIVAAVSITRIVEEKTLNERRRNTLLEERGRIDLLAGNSGRALAYLAGAAHDGEVGGARGFLIAEAIRPFEAQLATFEHARGGRTTIAYSPDAGQIATIGKLGIDVWNGHGELLTIILTVPPLAIQFDRSGKQLVAIGDDNAVRVWSLPGGKLEHELPKQPGRIVDFEMSPEGTHLVTAGDDGTRVWDLATKKSVVPHESCHRNTPVYLVRFSPNGQNVATAGDDLVCVWNVHTGSQRTLMRSHRDQRVTSMRWSPDGKYVLTASTDGTARLWYPDKGKDAIVPLHHESGLGIASAEISHDGRTIVTAGLDHIAQIWELPDEIVEEPLGKAKLVAKLVGHADAIEHAIFDAGDEIVATAGRDGKARLWNATSGQLIATFEHAEAVTSIALSPDRTRLLTDSQDGTARSWDITRGVARARFEVDAVPHAIASSVNGTIAVAGDDSRVTVWRDGTRTLYREHLARVFAVAFSPDGRLLASAGEDPTVRVREGASSYELGPLEQPVRDLAFSPDGTLLATATEAGVVKLWSVQTRAVVGTLRHDKPLVAIAYRDAALLAALDAGGALVLWDGSSEQPLEVKLVMNGVGRAIAFSRDGKRLVIGGKADARIFAVESKGLGDEVLRLDPPTGDVRAVAFTTDGSRVITAGADGVARLWDATKGKLVGIRDAHGGAIHALAQSADGNTLWTASDDKTVRAWNIAVESRPAPQLDGFLHDRVPWCLGDDDVVRPRTGECNEQHRSDGN